QKGPGWSNALAERVEVDVREKRAGPVTERHALAVGSKMGGRMFTSAWWMTRSRKSLLQMTRVFGSRRMNCLSGRGRYVLVRSSYRRSASSYARCSAKRRHAGLLVLCLPGFSYAA